METGKQIAQTLLQIKAIKLSPANPFTWASGWHSPIYCDNRKTLSYPAARKQIYEAFAKIIAEKYPQAEVIAGVATGAIACGVLTAEALNKPFIYVRSAPKDHGMANQVEGYFEALRAAGCEVLGMVAIFTYGFPTAAANFEKAGVQLDTLSNYNTLLELAVEQNYIHADELATLREWRQSPDTWNR